MTVNKSVQQILILSAFFVAAVFLWNTPVLYPVKLFVVMLHEMSHGLMAMIFGGQITKIQIDPQIGGYCAYTKPVGWFSDIAIASAGYLGSMIWGGFIVLLTAKVKQDRYISLGIGVITIGLLYFVIFSGEIFGILFTLSVAVFMIGSYFLLRNVIHDYMLKFIGLSSCLYVVVDIKSDLIDRSNIGSDADAIAKLTGIPSIIVGIFWILLAVVILFFILKTAIKIAAKNESSALAKKS